MADTGVALDTAFSTTVYQINFSRQELLLCTVKKN